MIRSRSRSRPKVGRLRNPALQYCSQKSFTWRQNIYKKSFTIFFPFVHLIQFLFFHYPLHKNTCSIDMIKTTCSLFAVLRMTKQKIKICSLTYCSTSLLSFFLNMREKLVLKIYPTWAQRVSGTWIHFCWGTSWHSCRGTRPRACSIGQTPKQTIPQITVLILQMK